MLRQERLVRRDDVLPRLERSSERYSSAGSIPPIVSMTMSTSGSSIICRASVVSRTPSSETPRGFRRSRTAAHFQRTGLPARRAIRSECSVNSRANAGPHRAQPDQPDCDMFCHKTSSIRFVKEFGNATSWSARVRKIANERRLQDFPCTFFYVPSNGKTNPPTASPSVLCRPAGNPHSPSPEEPVRFRFVLAFLT